MSKVLLEQKFTRSESACIGAKIKEGVAAGKAMDQAIAAAISQCAPAKATAESRVAGKSMLESKTQPREVEFCEFIRQERIRVTEHRDERGNLIDARLHDVKLLGTDSANVNPDGSKNHYPEAARAAAIHLYEGGDINVDHPNRTNPGADRSVRDKLGWAEGVYNTPDGIYAKDVVLDPTDPVTTKVLWFAKNNPTKLGFSHNAKGRGIVEGERFIVDPITHVRSTDLVSKPATTKGLFESEDPMPPTVATPAKALLLSTVPLLETFDEPAREAADAIAAVLAGDAPDEEKRAMLLVIATKLADAVRAETEEEGGSEHRDEDEDKEKTESRVTALEATIREMATTRVRETRLGQLTAAGLDPAAQPAWVIEALVGSDDGGAESIVADRRSQALHRTPTSRSGGDKPITALEAATELGL